MCVSLVKRLSYTRQACHVLAVCVFQWGAQGIGVGGFTYAGQCLLHPRLEGVVCLACAMLSQV